MTKEKEPLPVAYRRFFTADPDRQKFVDSALALSYDFQPFMPPETEDRFWTDLPFARELVEKYKEFTATIPNSNTATRDEMINFVGDILHKYRLQKIEHDELKLKQFGFWNDGSELLKLLKEMPDDIKHYRLDDITDKLWNNQFGLMLDDYFPAFYFVARKTVEREHEVNVNREIPSDHLPTTYRGRPSNTIERVFDIAIIRKNLDSLQKSGYSSEQLQLFVKSVGWLREFKRLIMDSEDYPIEKKVTEAILKNSGLSREQYIDICNRIRWPDNNIGGQLQQQFLSTLRELGIDKYQVITFDDGDANVDLGYYSIPTIWNFNCKLNQRIIKK